MSSYVADLIWWVFLTPRQRTSAFFHWRNLAVFLSSAFLWRIRRFSVILIRLGCFLCADKLERMTKNSESWFPSRTVTYKLVSQSITTVTAGNLKDNRKCSDATDHTQPNRWVVSWSAGRREKQLVKPFSAILDICYSWMSVQRAAWIINVQDVTCTARCGKGRSCYLQRTRLLLFLAMRP